MEHERIKHYKVALGAAAVLGAVVAAGNVHADNLTVNTTVGTVLATNLPGDTTANSTTPPTDSTNSGDTTTNPTTPPTDSENSGDTATNPATPPTDSTDSGKGDGTVTPPENPTDNSPKPPVTPPTKPSTPAKPPVTPSKPKLETTTNTLPPKQEAPQKQKPVQAPNSPVQKTQTQVNTTNTTTTNADYSSADVAGKVVYTGEVVKQITASAPIEKVDSSSPEKFIQSIAPRVQVMAGKNNLYASIILAQAILESGYGKSSIFKNDFNIFNITGAYLGKSVAIPTIEYDANGKAYQTTQNFRVYSNYEQSLADYINLMLKGTTWNSKIYAGSWKTEAKTYQDAAKALQGIFVTDPEYANKLIQIIKEYKLYQYDNVTMSTKVLGDKVPTSPLLTAKLADSNFPTYNGVEYPGASSYAFGNCTQYVYNRIFQLGGYIGQHMGNGGEWGINAAVQGYYTTSVPTEGYAVSFPPGVAGSSAAYGHVAFVEKVYPDGSILVSEMNVKGLNIVSERLINAGTAALATYIQPK